jgi:hypothetical protein
MNSYQLIYMVHENHVRSTIKDEKDLILKKSFFLIF